MNAGETRTAVIGSGPAGLITAKVLVDDGFDVTVFTRDTDVGGVYAPGRMYPELTMNNVYGEFNFSSHPMPLPKDSNKTGGRLYGQDMQDYLQSFANYSLKGRINFVKEVLNIRRPTGVSEGWIVEFKNIDSDVIQEMLFHKVVLCTGGCSNPKIPPELTPSVAKATQFDGPVIHSSEFARHHDSFLSLLRRDRTHCKKVVVVGGGKSAMDIATYLSKQDFNVTMVFETTDVNIAAPLPLPGFLRRSRLLAVLSPCANLNTRLERFLHTTSLGSIITRGFWNLLHRSSRIALNISSSGPLVPSFHPFWSIHVNDLGQPQSDGFHAQFDRGKITVISPARVTGYARDEVAQSVVLSDGTKVEAEAVVLATGFKSSWDSILSTETRTDIGLNLFDLEASENLNNTAHYESLRDSPTHSPYQPGLLVHRGIAPINNLDKRDFAINGANLGTANGMTHEVSAHWISSYFLRDSFLRIPNRVDALKEAHRQAIFMQRRFPRIWVWFNESYSAGIVSWNWPQLVDSLLDDMSLPNMRSGGNWLTWIFKVIDLKEIVGLGSERQLLRRGSHKL